MLPLPGLLFLLHLHDFDLPDAVDGTDRRGVLPDLSREVDGDDPAHRLREAEAGIDAVVPEVDAAEAARVEPEVEGIRVDDEAGQGERDNGEAVARRAHHGGEDLALLDGGLVEVLANADAAVEGAVAVVAAEISKKKFISMCSYSLPRYSSDQTDCDSLVNRLRILPHARPPVPLDRRPVPVEVAADARLQRHLQLQLLEVHVEPRRLPDVLLVRLHHARQLEDAQPAERAERREVLDVEHVVLRLGVLPDGPEEIET